MPDNVSCPDPNEAVTRAILAEELEKESDRTRQEFAKYIAASHDQLRRELSQELSQELSRDIARQLGAYEEARRLERIQERRVLEDNLLAGMRAILQPVERQAADHESRIVRLEARPAKRRATPRRKPK